MTNLFKPTLQFALYRKKPFQFYLYNNQLVILYILTTII